MAEDKINPSAMVTHVGGITSGIDTIMDLPNIAGGKKLIYTQLDMPLIALTDLAEAGADDPLYAELAKLCEKYAGLWNSEAESYLLENGKHLPSA